MSKQNKLTYSIKGRTITVVDDPDINRMVAAYLLRQKYKENKLLN